MKKILLRIISIIMTLVMVASIILLIGTVTGDCSSGGFIDLTNLVQYFLIGVEIISGVIAFVTWKLSSKSRK